MRMRHVLPLVVLASLSALAGCKDEKKAEPAKTPPAASTQPAQPDAKPADKPADKH